MEKRYLSPLELLRVARQHVMCAEYLLRRESHEYPDAVDPLDVLAPVTSLMYLAFQLTFKAYCLQEHRPIKEYKNLMELVALNHHLGFSNKELNLFKTLARQQVFHKGLDYDLWDDYQQLQVFCAEIMDLYEKVYLLMPVELQIEM